MSIFIFTELLTIETEVELIFCLFFCYSDYFCFFLCYSVEKHFFFDNPLTYIKREVALIAFFILFRTRKNKKMLFKFSFFPKQFST